MDHKEDLYIADCFNDDLELLSDFMEDEDDEDLGSLYDYSEDEDFESHCYSDKEAAEILGSPSEGINCDPENLCVICLDPLQKCYGDMKELPCKHTYHYNCILTSTKTKNNCPMCRGEYDYRERKPVDHIEYPQNSFFIDLYIPRPLAWMDQFCFFMPEMEEAFATFDEAAQVNEYGYWEHIEFHPNSFHVKYSLEKALARIQMEEAVALFDEAKEILKLLRERMVCNPKNVCGIWHIKPVPCKEIYILRSSKMMKRNCVHANHPT